MAPASLQVFGRHRLPVAGKSYYDAVPTAPSGQPWLVVNPRMAMTSEAEVMSKPVSRG